MNDLAAGWAEAARAAAADLCAGRRLLLPNEPKRAASKAQAILTDRYLLPARVELEAFFLAVRALVDPPLERTQPIKLGEYIGHPLS